MYTVHEKYLKAAILKRKNRLSIRSKGSRCIQVLNIMIAADLTRMPRRMARTRDSYSDLPFRWTRTVGPYSSLNVTTRQHAVLKTLSKSIELDFRRNFPSSVTVNFNDSGSGSRSGTVRKPEELFKVSFFTKIKSFETMITNSLFFFLPCIGHCRGDHTRRHFCQPESRCQ